MLEGSDACVGELNTLTRAPVRPLRSKCVNTPWNSHAKLEHAQCEQCRTWTQIDSKDPLAVLLFESI